MREAGFWAPVLLFLCFAFLLACYPLDDEDIWWHLRAGQRILSGAGIPRIEIDNYTALGKEWVDLHWLFQFGASWLYSLGGATALVIAKAFAVSALFGLCLMTGASGAGGGMRAGLWILPLTLASARVPVRPELITFGMVALYLVLLSRSETSPRALWLLPPLQALWVNSHGLFILGPVLAAAFAAEWIFAPGQAGPPKKRLAGLIPIAVSWLACFANPYGLRGVLFPFELSKKLWSKDADFYQSYITEFIPTTTLLKVAGFTQTDNLLFVVLLVLSAASFVLVRRFARIRLHRALLFVAFTFLGLSAIRNVPLFALVLGYVLASNATDSWQGYRRGRSFGARGSWLEAGLACSVLAALCACVFSGELYRVHRPDRTFGIGEAPGFPHGACRFAARPDMPKKIFAVGIISSDVCFFHKRADQKLFMDGRLEVTDLDVHLLYERLTQPFAPRNPGWDRVLSGGSEKAEDLPLLVVQKSPYYELFRHSLSRSGRWRRVYEDELAEVFVPGRPAGTSQSTPFS
jgi:hypothetical protein